MCITTIGCVSTLLLNRPRSINKSWMQTSPIVSTTENPDNAITNVNITKCAIRCLPPQVCAWYASKYQYGKRKETLKYCRECCVEKFTDWPRTNRATGFARRFHPRLCSKECFDYFHTHNIRGLDYARKKRKRRSNSRQNTNSDSNRNSNSSSQVGVDTQNTSGSTPPSVRNQTSRRRNTRYDV